MKPYTLSNLRQNIYKVFDQINKTGIPINIEKNGIMFEIKLKNKLKKSKLSSLVKRNCLNVDPEEIVSIDWSKEWNEDL